MERHLCSNFLEVLSVEYLNLSPDEVVSRRFASWRLPLIEDIPIEYVDKLVTRENRSIGKVATPRRTQDLFARSQVVTKYLRSLVRCGQFP